MIVPYLKLLKKSGCDTLVDSTPIDEGRNVEILKMCAKEAHINIITNIGTFCENGYDRFVGENDINHIVDIWTKQFYDGIDNTDIRPGFIKISLDDNRISFIKEKALISAVRTSKITGLPIQCHSISSKVILEATRIIKKEGLNLNKFIWAHADNYMCISIIEDLIKQGMWVEIDSIGSIPYIKHIELLKYLINKKLLDRILISQDAVWYKNDEYKGGHIIPYHRIFTEFIPLCKLYSINEEVFNKLLVDNPQLVLNI